MASYFKFGSESELQNKPRSRVASEAYVSARFLSVAGVLCDGTHTLFLPLTRL